jgi:hypothetical protein
MLGRLIQQDSAGSTLWHEALLPTWRGLGVLTADMPLPLTQTPQSQQEAQGKHVMALLLLLRRLAGFWQQKQHHQQHWHLRLHGWHLAAAAAAVGDHWQQCCPHVLLLWLQQPRLQMESCWVLLHWWQVVWLVRLLMW